MAMGKASYPQKSPFIPTWPHPYPHYTYVHPRRNPSLFHAQASGHVVRSYGDSSGEGGSRLKMDGVREGVLEYRGGREPYSGASMTASRAPIRTACPGVTSTAFTIPACGAVISFSIFMASITQMSAPDATVSPGWTVTESTVP